MSDAADRPIRVLLVDDHAVVRKGLRALPTEGLGVSSPAAKKFHL